MHGGTNAGAPVGNRNALKHGVYSKGTSYVADTIAELSSVPRKN
jgi:uncharacterized protein YjcR